MGGDGTGGDGKGKALLSAVAEMWRRNFQGMGLDGIGMEGNGGDGKGKALLFAVAEMWRRNFQGTGPERKGGEGTGVDGTGLDWIGFFSKLKHARASNANIDSQTDRNIANNYSQRPDGQPDEQVREGVEGHHRQTKEGR